MPDTPTSGGMRIFDCGGKIAALAGERVPVFCSCSRLSPWLRGPGHLQMPEAAEADHAGGSEDHAGQKQGDLEAAKE